MFLLVIVSELLICIHLEEQALNGWDQLTAQKVSLIYPQTTDGKCPFLREDLKCNIYEDRPSVCKEYGSEKVECLTCPFQDKSGRVRAAWETKTIKRRIQKTLIKMMKKH